MKEIAAVLKGSVSRRSRKDRRGPNTYSAHAIPPTGPGPEAATPEQGPGAAQVVLQVNGRRLHSGRAPHLVTGCLA
jgi:hypothetical protein